MILTDTDILEFREACRKDGFELASEDARFYALRVLRLYEIICRPLAAERNTLAKSVGGATIETPPVERNPTSPLP